MVNSDRFIEDGHFDDDDEGDKEKEEEEEDVEGGREGCGDSIVEWRGRLMDSRPSLCFLSTVSRLKISLKITFVWG